MNASPTKFTYVGRFLVKETYDRTGKIEAKQYFDKDTIPDGAAIEYYPNGKVESWIWYIHNDPYCGVFFNEQGDFDTLKGNPFLDVICCNGNNDPDIKLINPPQVAFRLLFKDIYKKKVIKKIMYEPLLTDTVSWVPLDEYKYQEGHNYKIYFYVVDTVKTFLLYQDSLEIKEKN